MYGGDALTTATMRAILAAPIFIVWFLCNGSLKKVRIKDIPFYIIYGIVAFSCTSFLYLMTVELLSSTMAAILQYTSSAFVIILNRVFYKEPITGVKIIALLCAFGGCFLVVKGYDVTSFSANIKGILIGLLSGFCFSMTTVLGGIARKRNTANINAGLMIIFGALPFLIVRLPWTISVSSIQECGAYIGLAVVCTVASYTFYLKGMATGLEGGIASIFGTTEPVTATLIGSLLFQDRLEILQIVGIVIVICGILLPILFNDQRVTKERVEEL